MHAPPPPAPLPSPLFHFFAEENLPRRFGKIYIWSEAKLRLMKPCSFSPIKHFLVCFWCIISLIPKKYLVLDLIFWQAILSFYSIWFPKLSEWLKADLWADQGEAGQERNDFLPPTLMSSLSTIKQWYPSEDPPLCSSQPTHWFLTQTSISARQEKEREREGWRKRWTEFFERSKMSGRRRHLATDAGTQRYPL